MPTTEYGVDAFFQNAGTSPKMVYDVAGVLGWSPHNLYYASEDLTHPSLAGSPGNVTAVSSTKLVEQAINGGHTFASAPGVTTVAGQAYCYWIEATAAGCDRFMLYGLNLGGQGKGFDLTNGTTFTVGGIPDGGLINSGILALGGGRYRCWITMASGGAAGGPSIYMMNGTAYSYMGDPSRGLTIHRQQLNRGTVPTAYLPTTSAARFGLALDYDPVTHAAKGLLVEPAGTNMLTWSSDFSNAGLWIKTAGVTVAANDALAPNGVMEADKIVFPGAGYEQIYYQLSAGAGSFAKSVFIKGTAGQTVTVQDGGGGAASVLHTLTGGWDRVRLSSATGDYFVVASIGSVSAETARTVWLWGAQVETGTVATSPIPTLGATVTRAVDIISFTAASINHSATAGSWWVEHYVLEGAVNRRMIDYNSAVPLFYNSGGWQVLDGTVFYILGSTLGAVYRAMMAFQVGDRAVTFNGAAPVTDTGQTTGLLSPATIYFSARFGTSSEAMIGYIRKVRYLPRRPTNAELQTMTT